MQQVFANVGKIGVFPPERNPDIRKGAYGGQYNMKKGQGLRVITGSRTDS